jgi:hypothetical protein
LAAFRHVAYRHARTAPWGRTPAAFCVSCAHGAFSNGEGATVCTLCKDGIFHEILGASQPTLCNYCAIGTFSNGPAPCAPCAEGVAARCDRGASPALLEHTWRHILHCRHLCLVRIGAARRRRARCARARRTPSLARASTTSPVPSPRLVRSLTVTRLLFPLVRMRAALCLSRSSFIAAK